jgi:hypothetical protein
MLECSFLRAEGVSWSLDVLYKGLEIRILQFLIPKYIYSFSVVQTFKFLVIKTLDLHRIRIWIQNRTDLKSGSGSALNQWRSETLLFSQKYAQDVMDKTAFTDRYRTAAHTFAIF